MEAWEKEGNEPVGAVASCGEEGPGVLMMVEGLALSPEKRVRLFRVGADLGPLPSEHKMMSRWYDGL